MQRVVMDYRPSEIKAGIFILVSLVVLASFLVVILGLTHWENTVTYRTSFSYVGGIEEGSLVRLAGMEVGRVAGFSHAADGASGIQVLLEVNESTPIRANSEAFLSTIGLMGSYYVEITPGTPDASRLPSGALIPSKEVTGLAQMSGPMTDMTSQATVLLKRLNELLNDDNRRNLSEMLMTLNRVTADNADHLAVLLENVNRLTLNLNRTVLQVNALLAANDSSLQQTMQQVQVLLGESQTMVARMNQTLQTMNSTMVDHRQELAEILDHSIRLTRNLQEFSQTIKEQPWNLVRKSYPPERKLP
ncbi:MAG TPA: MlaD family protein [bacterium]|nr:MlaD family protein [bacterium]